jgi:hypothetical protein
LRHTLRKRVDRFSLPPGLATRLWSSALLAVAIIFPMKHFFSGHPVIAGVVLLPWYGALYLCGTLAFRVPEAWAIIEKVLSKVRRRLPKR